MEGGQKGVVKPMRKTLRGFVVKPDILIHVKGGYALPINAPVILKAAEGFFLTRGGGKNHTHL